MWKYIHNIFSNLRKCYVKCHQIADICAELEIYSPDISVKFKEMFFIKITKVLHLFSKKTVNFILGHPVVYTYGLLVYLTDVSNLL